MAERSYRWWVVILALVGVSLDQWTKYGVFDWLHGRAENQFAARREPQGEYEVVPGAFKLLAQYKVVAGDADGNWAMSAPTLTRDPKVNQGALFGFGGKYGPIANGLFAVVSVLAAVAILIWSRRPGTGKDFALCAALGLILAGTFGNLYDRVVFDGVRDFLYFYWIEWPVFNVADCCLVFGAGLLLVQAFLSQPATSGAKVAETVLPTQVAQAN
jgi:lipoprotein signal peptidase